MEQNIKMKLQLKAKLLRRYTNRSNHYQQSKSFIEKAKKFYDKISRKLMFKNHLLDNK